MRMKSILLAILLSLCLPAMADDALADKAATFSRHFVEGDYAALHEMMAPEMQEAMTEALTSTIREQILSEGTFKALGEPWD